jgi:thiol-disulfide isomerase/thioredoxin
MNFKNFIIYCCAIFTIGCPGELKVETSAPDEPSPITWTECGDDAGDHPCDFTLEDQNGDMWNLYENYGSPIIIDFSTEWCGYCQIAAANTQHVSDEYADDDLIYVTILVEDSAGNSADADTLKRWADFFGITDPVLAGSRDMLDSGDNEGWMITGWPTFFIINSEMKIDSIIRGYSDQALDQSIQNIISKEAENSAEG